MAHSSEVVRAARLKERLAVLGLEDGPNIDHYRRMFDDFDPAKEHHISKEDIKKIVPCLQFVMKVRGGQVRRVGERPGAANPCLFSVRVCPPTCLLDPHWGKTQLRRVQAKEVFDSGAEAIDESKAMDDDGKGKKYKGLASRIDIDKIFQIFSLWDDNFNAYVLFLFFRGLIQT